MSANRRHRKTYNEPGHAHELTFGCFHRHKFLSKERTCQWLAESVSGACSELEFSLWAYVFMPDHVHLILHAQRHDYDVARFLQRVKHPVSRKALAFLRRESPEWLERVALPRGKRVEYHFWQRGGGFDRNITEPRTLECMIEYVHMNPVRQGLVERAAQWRWSSAGWSEGQPPNTLPPDQIPYEWTIGMSPD